MLGMPLIAFQSQIATVDDREGAFVGISKISWNLSKFLLIHGLPGV